jgi:large repetitive protein
MKSLVLKLILLLTVVCTNLLYGQSATLHYPNGFETLNVGSVNGILWNYSGFNTVRLELSTNNGSSWTSIAGATSLPNTQSYFNWTVPGNISALCLIRVVDNGNTSIRDESNNNFQIIAAPIVNGNKYLGGGFDGYSAFFFNHIPVTVNFPNGGDSIIAGTRQYITWTYNSLNQVDVEYSVDNGSNWTNISTVSGIQGYTIWNVPVLLSNTCLVRVIDVLNSNNVDQSNSLFTIMGVPAVNANKYSGGTLDGNSFATNVNPVRVLAPNGAETLVAGNNMTITWSYPTLNNVNILLSTNNGSNWSAIGSGIPSTNATFTYLIPITQTASTQCLVRVQDAVNGTFLDDSNNPFTIQSTNRTFGGSFDGYSFGSNVSRLQVVNPNGGETLFVGSQASIVWTYQSLNLVQPAYSTNNGSNWINVGGPVSASLGNVNWTIPASPSTVCLVRVSDFADSLIQDISNSNFAIQGLPSIDLGKYSGGANDGYHFDGPRLEVLNPNGGEQYYAGMPMDIHWRYYNSASSGVPNVAIELSTDGGSSWSTTITGSISATTGFFRYTTPAISTTQARVRVRDLTTSIIRDSSQANFTIINPALTVDANKYSGGSLDGYSFARSANPIEVVSPNGGETVFVGSQVSIVWNYNSYNNVQVSGSTDNGSTWFNIGSALQGVVGVINWVPSGPNVSPNCRVRVVDVNNPTIRDSSDFTFIIDNLPLVNSTKYSGGNYDGYSKERKIIVSNPNGGELYYEGQSISVSWSYRSLNPVIIEGSTNNGSSWFTITASVPGNQGVFNWTPSNAHISTTCLVRITDTTFPSISDVSNAVFEIRGVLSPVSNKYSGGSLDGYSSGSTLGTALVVYPNGGEVLYASTRVTLNWSYLSSNTVQLAYSTDNGSNWVNITTVAGNLGYFNWDIPALNSTQMLFRFNEVSNPLNRDSSNAVFTIIPIPTLNNGKYSGGEYDGYVSHSNLSPDPVRYLGGFYNGYDFGSTRKKLNVLNPNGGESWAIGSVQSITWNYLSVNNVLVEISTDGGSSFSSLGSFPAMNGMLNYTVPNTPSTNCLIRVTDSNNSAIRDTSNAVFEIVPMQVPITDKYSGGSFDGYAMRSSLSPVTVITPNGGENLFVGMQYTILWNYNSQNNVRIEFSSDGGSTFSTIVTSIPAQQMMYNWIVPGILSNACRIRVRDALSSGINDVSDANFSIINLPIVNNDKYSGGSLDGYAKADACVTPIATLTGGANICSGNSTILTVTQSGTMPYSITYTNGTTPVSVTGINFTPYFIVLTPTSTATYSLISIANCLGAGTVNGSAVVTVSPAPSATLSGSANICTGGSTTLSVTLVGLQPWTISYTDGTNLSTVTGISSSPYLFTVTPLSNANYSLTSVATSCGTGVVSGSAAVTLNPPPSATLSGTQTVCIGSSATLTVNFTGGGPFNFTWTDGTTPTTQSGITSNPFFISITPSSSRTYTATGLNTTCTGTTFGTAVLTVNPVPALVLSGSQIICPGNPATLTFVLTGSSPWNLSYSDGTSNFSQTGITASPFTVVHSPSTTRTYSPISLSDALCSGSSLTGTAVVQVNTPPTAVIVGTQSICPGNAANLTFNLTGPTPWSLTYTNGTTPVSITGITSSPFVVSVTPAVNSTYSLTAVSSSCTGTVSGNAVISLVTPPTAVLSGNQTVCPGAAASLSVALTGAGPWDVVYSDGTNPFTITGITNTSYTFSLTPSGSRTYSLTSVNSGCAGVASGTASVQVHPAPIAVLSGSSTICTGGNTNLTFTLGGTQPWSIVYQDGTTQTTRTGITSSPFIATVTPASSRTYSIVSVSDLNCTVNTGTGTAAIRVDPVPTASISGSGTVCAGVPVTMSVNLNGVSPWTIQYTDGTTVSTVSGISSSPYSLSVSATSSRTYTLASLSGSCTGNVSGSAILTITPSPTANLTGTTTVCPGNPTTLSVAFTSLSPWNITYTSGTTPVSLTGVTSNPYLIAVTPGSTTTYTLTSVQNSLCTGVATGTPVVTVSPAPQATLGGNSQICQGNGSSVSIQFTGAGPWDIIWSDGTALTQVTGITSNPYSISVTPTASTTYSLNSVISGCSGTVSGSGVVQVFPVPSATLTGGAVICSGGSTTLSVQFTGAAPWAYTYTDGTLQTSFSGLTVSPHILTVNPSSTRSYSLISMSGLCSGTVSGQSVVTVNNLLPNAVLSGNNTICANSPTNLSFNLTGNSPWNIIYTDGVVPYTIAGITSTPHIVSVTPSNTTTYSILNVNNVCGNGVVFGTAQILTFPGPIASLTGNASICPGGQSVLTVNLSGPSPWNLTWTNGTTPVTQTGLTSSIYTFSVSPTATTTYSLVSVSSSCSGTVNGTALISVLGAPTATLSGNQTICNSQTAQLTFALSGAGPYAVTYSDGFSNNSITGITASSFAFTVTPTSTRTYSIVSVVGACSGSGSGTAQVTVQPSPQVTLSGPATFCTGGAIQLSFALSGSQPWSLTYTDGTTSSSQTGITSSPFLLNRTPSGSTTYTVTNLSDQSCSIINPGTTLVVNQIPVPTASLSGSGTVCAGVSQSFPITLAGNAPWVVSYTDGTTTGTVSGITSSPYSLVVSALSTRTYSLISVSGAGCIGSVSGNAQLVISPSPTLNLTGNVTICPGNSTLLTFNLVGASPWNLTYSNGTTSTTISGITSSPFTTSVTPSSTTTYQAISVQNVLCTGIATGSSIVTVSPAPHATLSGNLQVCTSNPANLSVSFTGAGPWDLTWTNGTTPVLQSGITSNPYILAVTPTQTTTYSLVSVVSGCLGTVSGLAVVQTSSPPSASLSGGAAICAGGSTALSVALTGTSPWSYSYTDGTVISTIAGINSSPLIITVSPNSSRTYASVSVNGLCSGSAIGSGIVTVNNLLPNAVMSGNNAVCTGNSSLLTFNLTGNSPWSIIYTDGIQAYSISGITNSPHLVSVTPVSSTTYSILNVNNACGNGVVFGTAQVGVSPGPTASMSGNLSICSGGQTNLSVTLAGPSPWNLTWTDGTTSTTRTGITTANYLIAVTPTINTTYNLVSVGGVCNGTATGSVQVSVLSPPVATLTGTQTICSGQPSPLTISLSGAGPFDVTWTDGTSNVTVAGITTSTYVLTVSPTTTRVYSLVSVNGACVGVVSGTASVTVIPSPQIVMSGPSTYCPGNAVQFSFSLTGIQPWSIIYSDGTNNFTHTSITSTPFLSSVTPSGNTTYVVTALADANCVISNPGAQATVSPLPVPTASISGSGTVCAGSFQSFPITLTGNAPWNVTYTDGTSTPSINGITSSPYFLQVSANSARTYTLVSVQSGGCSGTLSGSAQLSIAPSPVASISGNTTVCPGNGTNLSIALTGVGPWNLTWTDGTNSVPVAGITASPYVFAVSPASTRSYTVSSVQDVQCSGTATGMGIVTVSPVPQASMAGVQQICTGGQTNLSINLTGTGPWSVTWTDGTTPQLVTGISSQPYTFSVTPSNSTTYTLQSVFSGCAGTVSGSSSVQVSTVPTASISGSATICTGGLASLSIGFTGLAPWNFTYTDGTNPVSITGVNVNPYVLAVSPNSTRTYTLLSMNGLCTGTVSGSASVNVNTLLPNAVLSGSNTICTGNGTNLSVNLTGNSPWSITYTNGILPITVTGITSSPLVFSVSPVSPTTYTILNVNNICGNGVVFGTAVVSPTLTPTAVLSGAGTICPGGFTQLSVNMTGVSPWNLTWTDGTSSVSVTGITSNPYLISASPVSTSTYQIQAFSNLCTGTFSGSSVVTVLSGGPTASMAGTQTICTGNAANLSVNLTGTPPWTVVYTNGINQITANNVVFSPYVVSVTPVFNSTYTVLTVSDNVCIGSANPAPAIISLTNPPVAGISGNHTICSGQTSILTVVLTGSGPWNISYTDGTSIVGIPGITSSPYLIQVTPAVNSTYILNSVFGYCTGSSTGQATVRVNVGGPSATFSPGQTICAGTGVTVPIQFTGQAPWNITWTDGTNNTVVLGITSNPYLLSVTPLTTTSYTLTQLSDALCTGTLPLVGSQITVIPQPVAVISGTQSVCLGTAATISVALSGTGPWNLTWTDGTSALLVTGITSSPYLFSTTPSANTTYSLGSVFNQCSGSVSGTAVVSVLPSLSAVLTGSQNICPNTAATLSVSFTGTGPWAITYTDGTTPVILTGLTQNPYLIGLTPTASTTYSLSSVSNLLCTGTTSGQANVQILTVPTAVTSGSQTICQGNTATFTVGFTGSTPYTLRYTNGTGNTTITGIVSNPYFVTVSPSVNTTYTLSGLNNTCLGTFSGSHSVVVNALPTAAISGNIGVCVGNPASIPVTLNGNSPWVFTYTDGTLNYNVTGVTSSPYTLSVTPLSSTAYTITQVADLRCTNNGNFGTTLVSIVSPPTGTLSGPTSVCAGNTAQLNFFLTGAAPWSINYTDGTNNLTTTGISTSPFVWNVSPLNSTQYVLTGITDQNCFSTGLTHTQIVNVTSGPSATLSGSQVICAGQQATLSVVLSGTAPWSVQYSNGTQIITIPGVINPLLSFTVNPGSTTNYTLVSVSDALCNGSVNGNATVTVTQAPTAGITGSTSVCSGGSASLSVVLTGSPPWSFTWSNGVNNFAVSNVNTSPYVLNVTPGSTTFYSIVSVSSGACSGNTTNTAVVTVGASPTASFGSSQNICAGQTAVIPVSLSGLGPWSISYSDGVSTQTITGITTGNYGLQVTPVVSTTYTLTSVIDGSCTGSIVNATITVTVSTGTATASLSGSASVCSGNFATLLLTLTGSSPWSVTYSNGVTNQTITGITTSPYLFNVYPTVSTTYTPVTLSNACGIGTVSGNAFITVDTQAPTASFSASTNGYTASFLNTSTSGTLYLWNFGDGNTDTQYNTSHTYTAPGFYTVTLIVTNACGTFSTSQQIFINYGVGVDADKLNKALTIYPNPTSGKFAVQIRGLQGQDVQFTVTDLQGKAIADEKYFQIEEEMLVPLDISRQSSGFYFLKVQTAEGIEVIRKITLVKE